MLQVPVKSISGEVVGQIEVAEALFAIPMNEAVVHQALLRQMANARRGTADTKTRSEISGGGRKPWRQKGTGRARQGSTRSPQWRHGGVVFGPHPRSYAQRMPKKMRRLALRCLLSDKLNQRQLVVVQELSPKEPKTKEMMGILKALGAGRTSLLVTAAPQANIVLSTRNLPKVKALPAPILNVVDLLNHETLIMTVDAVRAAENLWAAQAHSGGEQHDSQA